MKRIISILLISCIIGGALHLDEMAKSSFLISHFSEHKVLHPGDSFFDFLYKHYILNQKPESAKDKQSDSQLPFKSSKIVEPHFTVFVINSSAVFLTGDKSIALLFFDTIFHLQKAHYSIWQPPKV